MKWKLIIVQLVILAALLATYFATRHSQTPLTAAEREKEPLVRNLPLDRVATIEIARGEEKVVLKKEEASQQQAKPEEKWLVASAWNYPADTKKVKDFIDEMRTLKRGQFRGENPKLLKEYGLGEKERTTVNFKDSKEKSLATVVLGKTTYSMADFAAMQQGKQGESTSTTFVLLPGTPTVHEIPGSHNVSASRTSWLDLAVLDFQYDNVCLVQIQTEKEEFALVRRLKEGAPAKQETPKQYPPPDKEKEMKKEYEWLMYRGRGKEPTPADDAKVNSLVNTLAHLSASDAVEPMKLPAGEQEPAEEEMARYGFNKDKFFVGICFPREGDEQPVMRHFLQFGKAPDQEEFFVHSPQRRSGFEALFSALSDNPDQFVEKVLVYKVNKWSYDSAHKESKDFEKTPEKEPEGPPVQPPDIKPPENSEEKKPETPPETPPDKQPETPPDKPQEGHD